MGTTTETRITSTQAKDAIYKAHSISSSASEIDSKIKNKTYYISNNGLDTNNGLTELTPFKTIAKALTLISDYTTLKFECGSIFYESIIYQHSDLTFESYGIGNNPIVDGSSVINTPTLVSGNVWQTTNTYVSNKDGRVVMYQDGVPMQPVANQSECEALPNSYVAIIGDNTSSGTFTTMFHTGDSQSPLSNNHEYRTNTINSIRPFDDSGNRQNVKIKNVDARYGFSTTTLDVSATNNSVVEGVRGNYGSKHNIYVGKNGIAKNCIAYGSELQGEYGRSASLFVSYHNEEAGNTWFKFDNCVGIIDLKKKNIPLGYGQIGFLAHTSTGGFNKGILTNCYTRGTAGSFGLIAVKIEVSNCYFEKLSAKCIQNVSDNTSIKNSFFQADSLTNATTNEFGNVNYKNTTFINHRYANCQTANMVIDNCLFYGGNDIRRSEALMASSATNGALSLSMNNTIIFGYNNFTHGVVGTAYTGNYNIFFRNYGEIRAYYNGVQYQTLSSWQTATGQDANSVWLTPTQSKTFFLTDPNTGIVTINPQAQVTGGNGTVYTGTFPDGTLLTDKFTNKNYSHLKSKYVDELDLLQYQN